MRYFKIILIFFLFLLNKTSFANENIVEILKKENNIIFIRHAIAPGNGDPPNFDILDCSTQRNLSKEGELQALKIGKFFKENDIKFTKVLSSEWCRCKDTAKIAFGNYEIKDFLNSLTEVLLVLVSASLLLGIIFGPETAFVGEVYTNFVAILDMIGQQGLIALVSLIIIFSILKK